MDNALWRQIASRLRLLTTPTATGPLSVSIACRSSTNSIHDTIFFRLFFHAAPVMIDLWVQGTLPN